MKITTSKKISNETRLEDLKGGTVIFGHFMLNDSSKGEYYIITNKQAANCNILCVRLRDGYAFDICEDLLIPDDQITNGEFCVYG